MASNTPPFIGYPETKSEDYQLLGGINTKVSLYMNGPAEFRDISNLNFVSTGALTKRPGTTLFSGVTLGQFIGSSLKQITSGYEFQQLSGASYMVVSCAGVLTQMYATFSVSPTAFNNFSTVSVKPGAIFSFVTFVDRLFSCNGSEFLRLAPSSGLSTVLNAYQYSLPTGVSFSAITGISTALGFASTGVYSVAFSYVNDRGYVGPITPSGGLTFTLGGTTSIVFTLSNMTFLNNYYGVTSVVIWRTARNGSVLTRAFDLPWNYGNQGGGGDTLLTIDPVLNEVSPLSPIAPATIYLPYASIGSSSLLSFGLTAAPFIPRYLEIFNNQMFMAGFSTAPSTLWWSDIGEPEGIEPNFSVQVRTNDGDRITGMKSYLGGMIITKKNSFHILTGNNPNNFALQQISDQYGCLSNKAFVQWNDNLWFLDSKGIMEYNGANIRCVSDKIEPIFNLMNVNAAVDNACAIHVKKSNEIWFAIPANGATINNQIIVYDYVAEAWTHYDGVQAQCLFNARGGFSNLTPFAGGYTGGLVYFDNTLTSDNNRGITCSFDSMFFAARGQTTENMYRRYYLNVDPVLGFTQPIQMTFKTNFGATIQLSRTMFQAPYQSRIDFGLSARSIQASMYHFSASLSLKVNGFTIESRFQRSV